MESSLEALVFNCGAGINLGLLVNNLWTWVAVVTAAVSFWVRIRPIKPDLGPTPVVPVQCNHDEITNVQYKPVANPVRQFQEQTTPEPDRTASTSSQVDDVPVLESPTKGNKNYYKEYLYTYQKREEERECDGRSWDGGDCVVVEEWRRPTKAAVAAGWYGYQDRRVLDGSVVRLWDHYYSNGCCKRNGQGSWESRASFKSLIN